MACGDPGGAKCTGTLTASVAEVMTLSESFFEPLVAGDQKASLASLSLWLCPFRDLEGFLYRRSVVRGISHLKEHSGWVQCVRHLIGQPLCCSAVDAGMWGEWLWWWLHPLHMTQQYHLVSMAAQLSSTSIFHHNLIPHIPSIHLSTVNSNICHGIAPQSLNSSFQPLRLPGDLLPCSGYVWPWQELSDSHSI